jgi:hypothetical protein
VDVIQPHRWLGFGEISILMALVENQPDPANAKSASEILAMRQAGEGWSTIARHLGCRNLSQAIKGAALQAAAAREGTASPRA